MTDYPRDYKIRHARYVVFLSKDANGLWMWAAKPNAIARHGPYKTDGQAKGAAKRSLTKIVGGLTNPDDYAFVYEGEGDDKAKA